MVVLRPSEARQLLLAVDMRDPFGPRDRAMLVFAFHSGLRVSELCGLDVVHVARQGAPRETLALPASLGKGQKSRIIPLNALAQKAVASILAFNVRRGFSVTPESPLLVNRKHERITVKSVQRLVMALREKAGLDVPATPHSARHTFASQVAQRSGNLRVVQQLLGHQKLNTCEIYVHPTRDELRQAVDQLVQGGK